MSCVGNSVCRKLYLYHANISDVCKVAGVAFAPLIVLPFFGSLELKHTEVKVKLERSGREILMKRRTCVRKRKERGRECWRR